MHGDHQVDECQDCEAPPKRRRADEPGEEVQLPPEHPKLSQPYLEDLKDAVDAFGNKRTLRFFLRMFKMVRPHTTTRRPPLLAQAIFSSPHPPSGTWD